MIPDGGFGELLQYTSRAQLDLRRLLWKIEFSPTIKVSSIAYMHDTLMYCITERLVRIRIFEDDRYLRLISYFFHLML